MAYKSLNQESANFGGQTLPIAYFCKQSIIGALTHLFVYVQYCLWLFQRYKPQGRVEYLLQTAKPKTFTWGHLRLPTSALKGLCLILTLLFTLCLARWLCSSLKSLLAVPRYPRRAPTSRSLPMLLSQLGCNCKACLCNSWKSLFSCHFRETFPNCTVVKTATPPCSPKSTYPHFPLLCLSFSIALIA